MHVKSIVLHSVLIAACVGLVALDRALDRSAVDARKPEGRVGRLLSPAERAALIDPTFVIREPGGAHFTYAKNGAFWRIAEARDAVAKGSAAKAVLDSAQSVEGVIRTNDPAVAKTLGFDAPITLELKSAAGNGIDIAIELGASFAEPAGCYARRAGDDAVFQLDEDLASQVRRAPGSPHPPLTDVALVPEGWPGEGSQWKRLAIERGTERFTIDVRDKKISEEEMKKGVSPFEWIVVEGETTTVAAQGMASMYVTFASRAPYAEIVDRATVAAQLATPVALVRHVCEPGEPLVLTIGAPLQDGRVPVENSVTGLVLLVTKEVGALLLPEKKRLFVEEDPNPWMPYLR